MILALALARVAPPYEAYEVTKNGASLVVRDLHRKRTDKRMVRIPEAVRASNLVSVCSSLTSRYAIASFNSSSRGSDVCREVLPSGVVERRTREPFSLMIADAGSSNVAFVRRSADPKPEYTVEWLNESPGPQGRALAKTVLASAARNGGLPWAATTMLASPFSEFLFMDKGVDVTSYDRSVARSNADSGSTVMYTFDGQEYYIRMVGVRSRLAIFQGLGGTVVGTPPGLGPYGRLDVRHHLRHGPPDPPPREHHRNQYPGPDGASQSTIK